MADARAIANHELMFDVRIAHIFSNGNIKRLCPARADCIYKRSVRICTNTIEISMMKELLKSSVDPVSTLFRKQSKNLRCRDQAVFDDRS